MLTVYEDPVLNEKYISINIPGLAQSFLVFFEGTFPICIYTLRLIFAFLYFTQSLRLILITYTFFLS